MSASADTLQRLPPSRAAAGEHLPPPTLRELIHRMYRVMEASPDLITSQCLWQDKVEEAPSGRGQVIGGGYQMVACHCINPELV